MWTHVDEVSSFEVDKCSIDADLLTPRVRDACEERGKTPHRQETGGFFMISDRCEIDKAWKHFVLFLCNC